MIVMIGQYLLMRLMHVDDSDVYDTVSSQLPRRFEKTITTAPTLFLGFGLFVMR